VTTERNELNLEVQLRLIEVLGIHSSQEAIQIKFFHASLRTYCHSISPLHEHVKALNRDGKTA